jgi:hypothetical protein
LELSTHLVISVVEILEKLLTIVPNITIAPLPFTSNSLIISGQTGVLQYKNGTYTASESSSFQSLYPGYKAFVAVTGGPGFISGTGFTYITNIPDNKTLVGEWAQIQLPYALKLTSYSLFNNETTILKWNILGSNDGVNFEILDSQDKDLSFWSNTSTPTSFNLTTNKSFKYVRFYAPNQNGYKSHYFPYTALNINYIGDAYY